MPDVFQDCLKMASQAVFDSVHQEHGDWQETRAACITKRAILHHSLRCIVSPVEIQGRGGVKAEHSRGAISCCLQGSSNNGTVKYLHRPGNGLEHGTILERTRVLLALFASR